MKKVIALKTKTKSAIKVVKPNLFKDVKYLIEGTSVQVAYNINSNLVILNWNIGKRIQEEILKNKRAEYGNKIVVILSQQLTTAYGQGYTKSALNRMIVFARYYNSNQKVATLSQQLRWLETHEVRKGENTPIGLILCAEKSDEHIELLHLEKSNIKVSEYLTALSPKKVLERNYIRPVFQHKNNLTLKLGN